MAEGNENYVTVEYTGRGGTAADIADYRESGDARVKQGDQVDVPEELAKRMMLSSNWKYADGTDKIEVLGLEGERANAERAAANREVDASAESPLGGLTANDEHYEGSYDQQVREREEEHGVVTPDSSGAATRVQERLAELRSEEEETEGEAAEGDSSDEQEEEEINE